MYDKTCGSKRILKGIIWRSMWVVLYGLKQHDKGSYDGDMYHLPYIHKNYRMLEKREELTIEKEWICQGKGRTSFLSTNPLIRIRKLLK
ncbi:hypothetical protein ACDX78_14650 [Virgibacillus oceani]